MDWLSAAGLGLDHDDLRLGRTTADWILAGAKLRDEVAVRLHTLVVGVEQIGSSAVPGMLSKPIVDLAVGIAPPQSVDQVGSVLVGAGWIYRGDAGENGGHIFVLESRPRFRVAHLHVVDHAGSQWDNYLRLRDLLRVSEVARARYEQVKVTLLASVGTDRVAYTEGKSDIVGMLLGGAGPSQV